MNVFAPEENGNTYTRNSNCTFGGDLLTFSIKKPGNSFIIGISLQIFSYIPDQNLGENQNFETIIVNKDFKTLNEVTITIKAVPEYSYTISGSYTTDFGTLSPSRNHSSPGEFERLLQGVGCYIRSDHHPSPQHPAVFLDQAMSAISCADQCHTSSECPHGWAYQVATRRCQFLAEDVDTASIRPNYQLEENEATLGWASGLKSCSKQSNFVTNRRIKLI